MERKAVWITSEQNDGRKSKGLNRGIDKIFLSNSMVYFYQIKIIKKRKKKKKKNSKYLMIILKQ